jgi:hypothetical protein
VHILATGEIKVERIDGARTVTFAADAESTARDRHTAAV